MAQQKIQLRKIRDFSENINDTFQFIKQEFRSLLSAFILVAGAFMLVSSILSGLYQKEAFGFFDQIKGGNFSEREIFSFYTPGYFLSLLFSVISYASMLATVAIYMKSTEETGVSPTAGEVWRSFGKYFLRIALFSVLQSLLVFVGVLFCVVPGIYFFTVLIPYPFIIVNEDKSVGETFSRCFELIKENFWASLGIYIVVGLISFACSLVIGVILGLAAGLGSYFSLQDLGTTAAIVTSVVNIIESFFYLIFFVSVGLQYYNLSELKDGTGLERRLEGLGNDMQANTGREEQY